MYGIVEHAYWHRVNDTQWVLRGDPSYNTGNPSLQHLVKDLVLAVLTQVLYNNQLVWTGYIPPRTKNHLPKSKNLSDVMKAAIDFLEDRDSVVSTLVIPYNPNSKGYEGDITEDRGVEDAY